MDSALEGLLDDDKDSGDDIDFSPEGIEREKRRWRLADENHIDLFVLWSNMSGMGGESLGDLWDLVERPGSAALLKDFAVLSSRKKRLEKRIEFRKGKNDHPNSNRGKSPRR